MKKPLFFFSLTLALAGVIRVAQLEANDRPALVNMRLRGNPHGPVDSNERDDPLVANRGVHHYLRCIPDRCAFFGSSNSL